MKFIDLKKQYQLIENQVLQGMQKVLDHGQYIMGPEIAILESKLADFVGVKHAIANASGTDALLMAMMAVGVGHGDEVITTPFSFFASSGIIAFLGAKPVFVDIDPQTYAIDPTKIEAVITSKTKAIMPVSLYGQCANIKAISAIAERYQLPIIEDAAQSFGAKHHGAHSCGLTTIGCTSFFPSKPLGGYGDSGACFTDDDNLAKELRKIRDHGQNARYSHQRIGFNGRMDTLQAAILIEKLNIFSDELKLREKVAANYRSLLKDTVKLPFIALENTSVYAQFTIEVDDRAELVKFLEQKSIPTAIHYPIAIHEQEALSYLNYKKGQFPNAEKAAAKVVSLPMYPYITEEDQALVASAIKEFYS